MVESEERRGSGNEIQVGANGKKVYSGTGGVAGALRLSWTFASRAGSTAHEKWYDLRGPQNLKKYTTRMTPG